MAFASRSCVAVGPGEGPELSAGEERSRPVSGPAMEAGEPLPS